MRVAVLVLLLPIAIDSCASRDNYFKYVDYYPGDPDTNVILSAPHDGWIKLDTIPDRIKGCYDEVTEVCDFRHDCETNGGVKIDGECNVVTNSDANSSVLAKQMQETIAEITGKRPHLVVSRLHRSKLDPNRFVEEAAQHDATAKHAYHTFHGIIKRVHNALSARGPAVHFDIHGYLTHAADNWTEIGYNIKPSRLNADNFTAEESSVRSLAGRVELQGVSLDSLIRGEDSLGKLVQEENFRTVPSPQYPRPSSGDPGKYFRGGFITRQWGSLNGGVIDAVQIEFPMWVRDNVPLYGPKLGRAMATWIQRYYPTA